MRKLTLPSQLVPFKGVIYFIVILLVAHFFWKYTMIGDESDSQVTFFGIDLSEGFNWMAVHVTQVVYGVLTFLGIPVILEGSNIIRYENDLAIRIVWACTGFKQAYIFTVIIAFYYGPWKKKIWFIAAGLVVVYAFNLFRIAYIIVAIRNNPAIFDFLHEGLLKYLFYGIIFLMWVLWEEKISGNNQTKIEKETNGYA